jgi:hypothetical protein
MIFFMEVGRGSMGFLTIFVAQKLAGWCVRNSSLGRRISVDSPANHSPEPVLLIIADIGGYTRYMTANAKTSAHSQTIITELITALIRRADAPLEIAKLEGDAVFLFCRQPPDTLRWMETRAHVSARLVDFFQLFREKLHELSRSNHCTCHACAHIEKLRLKIVVHCGEALFHRVAHFEELAGVDVIIVHRLLKNSVKAAQYLLLTEAAMRELQFPETMTFQPGRETYEDIGTVITAYHDFDGVAAGAELKEPESFGERYTKILRTFLKLWFGPFTNPSQPFRNLSASASRPARFGFAVVTVLLTPIMLPVVAVMGIFRAMKKAD